MPTNFPSSLDNFTNPTSSDATNSVTVPHAAQHANINDAVEALQAKVGVDGSAVTTSLDYKVAQKQDVCAERTGNFTAAVHGNYIVTATATVTDPTPEAGHGYTVLVRNGTATVGGVAYSIVGTRIERTFHSGAWSNAVWYPEYASASDSSTGTINALAVASNQMRLTGAAPDLRGIVNPTNTAYAVTVFFQNASTIRNQAGTASASNRIQTQTGADFAVPANSTLTFVYDTVSSFWRVVGNPLFSSTVPGLVPLSGGGTTNYLRADGTWAAPAGGGGSAYEFTAQGYEGPAVIGILGKFDATTAKTIAEVTIVSDTLPVGSNCICELRKNSTTSGNILSSTLQVTTTESATNGRYVGTPVTSFTSASIADGDVLYAFLTGVGSTTPAANVRVILRFSA